MTVVDDPKSIAVLSLNYVGDVLFTTPAIAALKRRFPSSKLIVVAAAGSSPILDNNPNVQEVLVRRDRRFRETCRLASMLRRERVGVVAVLSSNSCRLGLLAWLSGARVRVGYSSAATRPFLTSSVERDTSAHHVRQALDVVALVGAEAPVTSPEVYLSDEEIAWSREFLQERGVRGEPVVGISPGTTVACKRWMPERYAALADKLADEGMKVLLLGSRDEMPLTEQVVSRMRTTPIVATGGTTLRQLAALLGACDVFVAGDTGPLHVATGLGIPVVGLYGPTDPDHTGPVSDRAIVVRKQFKCSPCGHHPTCEMYDCMRAMDPDEVLDAALRIASFSRPTAAK